MFDLILQELPAQMQQNRKNSKGESETNPKCSIENEGHNKSGVFICMFEFKPDHC